MASDQNISGLPPTTIFAISRKSHIADYMAADDDIEVVPIPLDRETIANLARLGRALGEHPTQYVARSILRMATREAATELAAMGLGTGALN